MFGSVEASLNKSSDKEVESLKAEIWLILDPPPYVEGIGGPGLPILSNTFWSLQIFLGGKCTVILYFEKDPSVYTFHVVEQVANMPHFRDYIEMLEAWELMYKVKQELILDLNLWFKCS